MTRPRFIFLLLAIIVATVGIVFKDVAAVSIATLVFMVFLESDYSQKIETQLRVLEIFLEDMMKNVSVIDGMLENLDEELSNRERSGGP